MYLKKYFTEGLIQVAILLSLSSLRVDIGLEPHTLSLSEIMLGPSAGITQTQFHNLWNRLDDGQPSHPKNIDLDRFFTSRRLLGWVRSLDRLQVPNPELETWLVHREPDMLPVPGELGGQPTPLERVPVRVEGDGAAPNLLEPGDILRNQDDEEEDEADDDVNIEVSHSLQECLRLLENAFPFTHQSSEEIMPVIGEAVDHESLSARVRGPLLSPPLPSEQPPMDLELQWQDLLAIMEPQGLDAGTLFPNNHDTDGFSGSIQNRLEDTILRSYPGGTNSHNDNQMIYQDVHPMETALLPGIVPPHHPESHLLSLIPSTELDQHNMRLDTSEALENMDVMISGDRSDSINMGLAVENGDNRRSPGDHSSLDMDFYPNDFTSASLTPQFEPNFNLPIMVDDEEDSDYRLLSPLGDLLENATMLDEMSLLDLALDEGFSPEMAAQLEEQGYLYPQPANRNMDQFVANMPNTEEDNDGTSWMTTAPRYQQDTSRNLCQESEEKVDSDSGLSLDCSFSPASPCGSESSCYSSSSTSSSSSGSSGGSLYSEGDEQKDEEDGINLDMEQEVIIKQEEEEGAVGGYFSSDLNKMVPATYQEEKFFNGLPWQEHIGHDHTYNQDWPSTPSPAPRQASMKQSKYSSQKSRTNLYSSSSSKRFTEAQLWSRDDRRARSLKIPFSNEVIVNMPVDDFNKLLANHRLNEQQLNLVRDIRRRGKNKMAAQNCRRRKLSTLLGLEEDVSKLRRRRAWLRREKKQMLQSLHEMEQRLEGLYQDVMLSLRDEEGRPLDATDYALQFEANGSATLTPRQQRTITQADGKVGKKHRDKKCNGSK